MFWSFCEEFVCCNHVVTLNLQKTAWQDVFSHRLAWRKMPICLQLGRTSAFLTWRGRNPWFKRETGIFWLQQYMVNCGDVTWFLPKSSPGSGKTFCFREILEREHQISNLLFTDRSIKVNGANDQKKHPPLKNKTGVCLNWAMTDSSLFRVYRGWNPTQLSWDFRIPSLTKQDDSWKVRDQEGLNLVA